MKKFIEIIIELIRKFLDSLVNKKENVIVTTRVEEISEATANSMKTPAPAPIVKPEKIEPIPSPIIQPDAKPFPTIEVSSPSSPLTNVDQQSRIIEARRKAKEEILEKMKGKPSVGRLIKTITAQSIDKIIPPEKPRLWYPGAITNLRMPTQGKYHLGFAQGAIIHFAADRGDGPATIRYGISQGFGFDYIAADGTYYQTHPYDEWTYHAGDSYWPGLGRFVHQWTRGFEFGNPGMLDRKGDKFYTWYKSEIPATQVVYISRQDLNIKPGYYTRFTEKQLMTVESVLRFMKAQSKHFKYELTLGHDEVAPGRKNDPGGTLPYPMKSMRLKLINNKSLTNKDREF